MTQDAIHLIFLPATDDPAPESAEYQAMLWAADRGLRDGGLRFSTHALMLDDDQAPIIHLAQVTLTTLTPAVTAVAVAWITARFGRKVRLKVGDLEAEARTTAEVERLMKIAAEAQANRPKAGDNG